MKTAWLLCALAVSGFLYPSYLSSTQVPTTRFAYVSPTARSAGSGPRRPRLTADELLSNYWLERVAEPGKPVLPRPLPRLLSQQDATLSLLQTWARTGKADDALVDQLMGTLSIKTSREEEELLKKIARAGEEFPKPKGAETFSNIVRTTLDRRRFARVDSAVRRVMAVYGGDLEAVIRTGSSGLRYLELNGGPPAGSAYRTLFSDDDLSFVGRRATEAAEMLNQILKDEGLDKLKVKGFDLVALNDVRGLDLRALDLMEPEKFLGEAGLARIKGEMLEKGAVVAERSGAGLAITAQPLRQFVEAKKNRMLAELLDENAIREAVARYGSLTMVGSCERQIVQAHGGWETLPEPDKVKYVLRQRIALAESGALRNIAEEGGPATEATLAKLRELKNRFSAPTAVGQPPPELTREELAWLEGLRAQNVDLAFKEIPYKMRPILAAAENSGTSVAANPEVRKVLNELATGFALMREGVIDLPKDQVLAKLSSIAGEDKELYKLLYTAYEQSLDLVQAVDQWLASGGTREAFIEMLVKANGRLSRLEATIARRAKKAGTPEAKTLSVFEEMFGSERGDNFFLKMAKNPTAQKVLLATLVASGGYVCLKTMYNSWLNGRFDKDLSDAAFAIIQFVPSGIGLNRALTEGMDAKTTLLFVKDALYLTPAWPIVLGTDALVITIDLGQAMQLQFEHEGLVDLFVYDGEWDVSSGKPKFVRLRLPGGEIVEKDELKLWLFDSKAVRVYHVIEGKSYWINDLSAVSWDVLNRHYVAEDPISQQLRQAAETQLAAIYKAEAWDMAMNDANFFMASASLLVWLTGCDIVCQKSPKRWCGVYTLLKDKMDQRKTFLMGNVMIPRIIELAEEKRALLTAAADFRPRIDKLQKDLETVRGSDLETVRGSDLGFRLAEKVAEEADRAAETNPSDTPEQKAMVRGKFWTDAFDAYQRIWESSKDIKQNIADKTGFDRAQVLQFQWTGVFAEDERKSEQSRRGFSSEISKIRADITRAKGSMPSVTDSVDKEAYRILGEVVFGFRAMLDAADQPVPVEPTGYFKDYAAALERVKALYAGNAAFQALLDKGAELVRPADGLVLDRAGGFEVRFTDPALARAYGEGGLAIKWTAVPAGTFRPNDNGLLVNFAALRPEPVLMTATVERRILPAASGRLSVTMPVTVPEDFLTLVLSPQNPKPGGYAGIDATIPGRFFGGDYKFHYKWSCENCTVEDFDRTRSVVTAPTARNGAVVCELSIEDANGKRSTVTRKRLPFSTTGADGTPTGSEPALTGVTADVSGVKLEAVRGGAVSVAAKNFRDAKGPFPAGKYSFKVVWQSTPAGVFTPKETLDAAKASLAVTAREGETVTVWGDILLRQGNAYVTVGKTSKSTFTVVAGGGLSVRLEATKTTLKPGETADILATVSASDAKRPFTFEWTGDHASASRDNSKVTFVSRKSGQYVLSVTVTDANGLRGTANIGLKVLGVTAILEGLPAGGVIYGTKLPLTTKVDGIETVMTAPKADSPSVRPPQEWVLTSIGRDDQTQKLGFDYTTDFKDSSFRMAFTDYTRSFEHNVRWGIPPLRVKPGGVAEVPWSLSCKGTELTDCGLGIELRDTTAYPGPFENHYVDTGTAKLTEQSGIYKVTLPEGIPGKVLHIFITVHSETCAAQACRRIVSTTRDFVYTFAGRNAVEVQRPVRIIWASEPGITFDPGTSEDYRTTALFDRMGTIKVWAEVQIEQDGVYQTVGETEQREVEVTAPRFTVTFDPPQGQGKVGQEIKATVVETPPRDPPLGPGLIHFVWTDPPSSNRMEYDQNSSRIGFKPKDTNPVQLFATARVPKWLDTIAEIKTTYTASAFTVKAQVIGPIGPKPQVWKEPGGLVTVERDTYCADEMVQVKGTIEGEGVPSPSDLRWRWTANEGTSLGNPVAQELTVSRHETGTADLAVEVRDKDGVLLGRATVAFSVTVSAAQLAEAKNKAGNPAVKLNANQLITQGLDYNGKQRFGEAVAAFNKAIEIDPKNTLAYLGRGAAHAQMGDRQRAMNDYNRAIALSPNAWNGYVARGVLKYELKDYKGALADFDKVISIDPNNIATYVDRALVRLYLNDFRGAVQDCDRAIAAEPNGKLAYVNRGFANERLGNDSAAIRDYDKVIELDPNFVLAFKNRGNLREKLGALREALSDYERALVLEPGNEALKAAINRLKARLGG